MSNVQCRMSNELYPITTGPIRLVSGSFDNFIRHSTCDIRHLTFQTARPLRHPLGINAYRNASRDRIENRRILLRQRAEFLQLFVGNVGLDPERDANLLETGSNGLIDAEESPQIDIAFHRRLDFVNCYAPRRGV